MLAPCNMLDFKSRKWEGNMRQENHLEAKSEENVPHLLLRIWVVSTARKMRESHFLGSRLPGPLRFDRTALTPAALEQRPARGHRQLCDCSLALGPTGSRVSAK